METKVLKNDYKGNQMFSIYEFDEEGNKNFRPLVNMGVKKASLILKHLEDLKKFLETTQRGG